MAPPSPRWAEWSGAVGDLGTFLPLVVALCSAKQLDLGTTLLASGLYNIGTGCFFRIPVCVQPMKAIAAVALAAPGAISLDEIMAAGLFVSGAMLLLGATGAMGVLHAAVPPAVIRGVQLAVGLSLAQKGIAQALLAGHQLRGWLGTEGLLLGAGSMLFLLVTTMPAALARVNTPQQRQRQPQLAELEAEQPHQSMHEQQPLLAHAQHPHARRLLQQQHEGASPPPSPPAHDNRSSAAAAAMCGGAAGDAPPAVPAALLIVLAGLLLALVQPNVLSSLRLGPSMPKLYVPGWRTLARGISKAGLPQLPLTGLNSVLAVTALAGQLFPERAATDGWRWQPRPVAMAVGLMNLGCWVGAFPCCTGSGGLAAQYKFGARSGRAPVLLGCAKIALALLFGSSLLPLAQHFPQPLLGSLLLFSGLELAGAAAAEDGGRRGWALLLLTAAGIIGLGGDAAAGFGVGCAAAGALAAGDGVVGHWRRWRAEDEEVASSSKPSHPGDVEGLC